jgi:hypothetical protein
MRGTIGSNSYFKNKNLLPRRYCGGSDLRLGTLLNLASYPYHVYRRRPKNCISPSVQFRLCLS